MAIGTARDKSDVAMPSRPPIWNNPDARAIFYQILVVAIVVGLGAYLVHNTMENLRRQSIATGFGFLEREAGFGIGEHLIPFSPADTYGRALLVGLLNTIYVAVIGIVLATILGTVIGICRLSSNWLIRKLSLVYVELFRNVPLLLQLFFWYKVLNENAPGPRQAWNPVANVFISNRGIMFPVPAPDPSHQWIWAAFAVGIVVSFVIGRWAKRRQMATGRQFPTGIVSTALVIGLPLIVFLASGAPLTLDKPELRGFNFAGGQTLSPEFAALLLGLVIYTASFIAEIVRAGILAVSWGQTEAASALGLTRAQTLRLIILPQALRVIVPPMTSQYLNLTKNSSLAVAIGFPELVSVGNTTINQTGQAIEGIAIIMAVYLIISLLISAFMNWYNSHVRLVER
jgi:general L-amino acid transport system permease protein